MVNQDSHPLSPALSRRAGSNETNGFLTAVVEDCCADQPQAHEQTLDGYPFIFERTTLDLIPERYPEWMVELRELDEGEKCSDRL